MEYCENGNHTPIMCLDTDPKCVRQYIYSLSQAVRAHRQENNKLSRRYAFISKVVLVVTIILAVVILTASLVISVGVLPRVTQEST